MAEYVTIPKDLKKIKTKVVFGLTKRQLFGFGVAGAISFPLYLWMQFVVKIPQEISMFVLFFTALPPIFISMYEKDGIPSEQLFKMWLKYKFVNPQKRRYQTTKHNNSLGRGIKRAGTKKGSSTTSIEGA